MEFHWRHLLYAGNLLSLMRLALAAPIVWLTARPGEGLDGILIGLIAIAIVSDWLDGLLSRRLNQVTDVGKVLDPVADKVVLITGLLALAIWRGFPPLLLFLLFYRDVLIVALGALVSKRIGRVTVSNLWGKANTLFVALTCLSQVVLPGETTTTALAMISIVTTIASGISYYRVGEPHLFRTAAARWPARVFLFGLPALVWGFLF